MSTLKQLVNETTNIKNELVTCHSSLKNNLKGKGVEYAETEKLNELIGKVGKIELGKKWASGTAYDIKSGTYGEFKSNHISFQLGFTPTRVFAYIPSYTNGSYGDNPKITLDSNYNNSDSNAIYSSVVEGVSLQAYITDIDSSGFNFMVSFSESKAATIKSLDWIVFE